jgi:hypothetical protein
MSVNTGQAGVHVAALKVGANVVGVYSIGSGAEIFVLSLSQWLDRPTGADRSVESADEVTRVGGRLVEEEGGRVGCTKEQCQSIG